MKKLTFLTVIAALCLGGCGHTTEHLQSQMDYHAAKVDSFTVQYNMGQINHDSAKVFRALDSMRKHANAIDSLVKQQQNLNQ